VYGLEERKRLLLKYFPRYLVYDEVLGDRICEIPWDDVSLHYVPISKMKKLLSDGPADEVENAAIEFASLLKSKSNIPWDKIGITGSILLDLHTKTSDIDLIVYGISSSRRVYRALERLIEEGDDIKPFDEERLKELYVLRSKDTPMPLDFFAFHEGRKVSQGSFRGRNYFIRFVKDFDEIDTRFGDLVYKPQGFAEIVAIVVDDKESIFTPCSYEVGDVQTLWGVDKPISELVSFRGRFCGQAKTGERVKAKGKVEAVIRRDGHVDYRLVLGGDVGDFMIMVR
jgi:hypothetical protein